MKSKLLAYAIDFVSYYTQKTEYLNEIVNIILFGSVARNEAENDSDIDLFIETINESRKIEEESEKIKALFFKSAKFKNYWELLGVKSRISIHIGKIDDWQELKPSVISNGFVLYGKFKPEIKEGKHVTFFVWENIKPNNKRVLFNKKLLGFSQNGKFYDGILQKYKGERLGKGSIMVPLESSNIFHELFKKYKISVKIKKVLDYF
ncbi:MAG: nucleotidyltransferase domain-containing protein [Nanoarchaeota archaeon]